MKNSSLKSWERQSEGGGGGVCLTTWGWTLLWHPHPSGGNKCRFLLNHSRFVSTATLIFREADGNLRPPLKSYCHPHLWCLNHWKLDPHTHKPRQNVAVIASLFDDFPHSISLSYNAAINFDHFCTSWAEVADDHAVRFYIDSLFHPEIKWPDYDVPT